VHQNKAIRLSNPSVDAATLHQLPRDRGILVRHLNNQPRIQQFLRISVGSPSECRTLLQGLEDILCIPESQSYD
jgi:histidinol-phosphate aminotransferase